MLLFISLVGLGSLSEYKMAGSVISRRPWPRMETNYCIFCAMDELTNE